MAMTDSDKTSTRGRTREYSEYDLTGGRTRSAGVSPETREWRSTTNRPAGMMRDITPRDVAMENADKFYEQELPNLMMKGLLGEDSGVPLGVDLGVSAVPGGALAEKLATGAQPGLLDMPGPNEIKMAALILGVPIKEIMRALGKHYLKSDAAADAFQRRMGAFPEDLQESFGLTFANRKGASGVPTASVPPMGIGSDIKGNRGYYRAKFTAGPPTSNARVINVNSTMGMSPEDAARQLQIEGSKAMSADLSKFGDPLSIRQFGMEDPGLLGEKAGEMIAGANKGLYKQLSNISDPSAVPFIEAMSQNPRLFEFYKQMQNPRLTDMDRAALAVDYSDVMTDFQNALNGGWWKPFPKEVLGAVEDVGRNRLSADDISTLIAGGAKSGALDRNVADMFTPRWIKPENLSSETFGRLMANYPDRAGVPMLTQPLQKMTKELQKNKRDLRMPGNGVTESIDYEFLGHPDWKRKGY